MTGVQTCALPIFQPVERSLTFIEQNNFVSKVLDLFIITRIMFQHVGMRYLIMGSDNDNNSDRTNNVNSLENLVES